MHMSAWNGMGRTLSIARVESMHLDAVIIVNNNWRAKQKVLFLSYGDFAVFVIFFDGMSVALQALASRALTRWWARIWIWFGHTHVSERVSCFKIAFVAIISFVIDNALTPRMFHVPQPCDSWQVPVSNMLALYDLLFQLNWEYFVSSRNWFLRWSNRTFFF